MLDGAPAPRKPITGNRSARTTTGKAATVPPRSVMNSRRRICPPKTDLVQFLKLSTLRLAWEREMAHDRPQRTFGALPSCALLHWRALHIGPDGERAGVEFSQVSDGRVEIE